MKLPKSITSLLGRRVIHTKTRGKIRGTLMGFEVAYGSKSVYAKVAVDGQLGRRIEYLIDNLELEDSCTST